MTTLAEVRRITWSIYWKWIIVSTLGSIVGGAIVGGILGGIVGIVKGAAASQTQVWTGIYGIAGWLFGIWVGFFFLNYFIARSIGKVIGGKQLVLIDSSSAREN